VSCFSVCGWVMAAVRLCIYLFAISEQVSKDSLRCIVGFWFWLGGGSGFFLYFSF